MNAAKENFLLKGYFNRKERAEEKIIKNSLDTKAKAQKEFDNENR